uniref:Uncharacterized protein n=1 Tax=Strigamia maritima TaxID=126957 RepID=T1JI77_STRMM
MEEIKSDVHFVCKPLCAHGRKYLIRFSKDERMIMGPAETQNAKRRGHKSKKNVKKNGKKKESKVSTKRRKPHDENQQPTVLNYKIKYLFGLFPIDVSVKRGTGYYLSAILILALTGAEP